jgi:drug/metabolite transporter (DMT)-like permease
VLYPDTTSLHIGDLLIVAAAAVAPFGNFFQRRARQSVSSESILFVRCAVSSVFIFCLAGVLGEPVAPAFSLGTFLLLAVNGVLLLGLSKIFWVEGIHSISVTKANALSGITPLFTLLFAFAILGNAPTVWQLSSFVPMFVGILLLGTSSAGPRPLPQ